MNLLLVLALTALSSPGAVVIRPVANMYSAPTEDADVVSQAICGVSVVVDEEKGEWVKVRTPDDYPGWMPLASLRRYRPGEHNYAATGSVVQVASLFANVYREDSVTKHQPVLTLPFEARLEVVPGPGNERATAGSRFACPTSAPPGFNAATSILTPSLSAWPKP